MKEVSGHNIGEQEFKKISKWAEDVYNIAIIVDYFVCNQPKIEECYNIAPVIKNLKNNVDLLNAFFINNREIKNQSFNIILILVQKVFKRLIKVG